MTSCRLRVGGGRFLRQAWAGFAVVGFAVFVKGGGFLVGLRIECDC